MLTGRKVALGGPELSGLFSSFRHSAFRLETLQSYLDPAEEGMRREFYAGGAPPPDDDLLGWCQLIRNARAAGKTVRRVHVVTEPHTPYMRFELWSYGFNIAAGEEIRIIPVPRGEAWPAGVPRADWWLFDNDTLARMIYDSVGRVEYAELVTGPAAVAEAAAERDGIWDAAVAVPYQQYMNARRDSAA